MCKIFNTNGAFHIYVDGAGGPGSDVTYNFGVCPKPAPSCNVLAFYDFNTITPNWWQITGTLNFGPSPLYYIDSFYTVDLDI